MAEQVFTLSPQYLEAIKEFRVALEAELVAAKAFGADRTEANWAKCAAAHEEAQAKKARSDALEPDWLKSE